MAYLGISPTRTDNRKIDTPLLRVGGGSGFDGTTTQFLLKIEGEQIYPDSELLVQAVLNGSQLNPKVDFFIQNDIITFVTPPPIGASFFAILGDRVSLNKPGTDTVTTTTIKNSAVTTEKIADNAITSEKIAPGTVIASDVADGAVTTTKLDGTAGSEAVTTAKIRDLNVTTGKIADSAVTTGKIADSNVTTGKIADSAVTTGKIADSNVTTGKIANDAITSDKIAADAVGTSELANNSVTTSKIAADSVTSAQIASGAVGNTEISNGAVTPDKINLTVLTDPVSPTDGQLIWNTFTNVAKIYNTSASKWDELLTSTNAGSLIGWSFVSNVSPSVSSFTERNTGITTENVISGYAFNSSVVSPRHVVISTNGKISYSSNLSSWSPANSNTVNNINTVTWGQNFFFAGANSNTLLTSSDGITWNATNGPFGGSGGNIVSSYYANGVFLIGSSFGEIASSTGATTFTLRSSNLLSPINSFVYNNGVYAAGGSAGDISTSSDANTWTQRLNIGGLRKVYLQPFGTGFIAVIDNTSNDDVTVKISTDGVVWTDLIVNPNNINTVNTFKYSSATQAFIIVNNEGFAYRSVDGKNWSLFNAPAFSVGTSLQSTFVDFVDIAGDDYYILGGTKNVSSVLTSYFSTATFNTTNTQLESNKNYIVDTSYGEITLFMPLNPSNGDIIRLADGANTWSTTTATVNSGSKTFLASTGSIDNVLILDFSGVNIDIVWTGTYWRVY